MFVKKIFAVAATVVLGIALAQVDAVARGVGGPHGGFGRGYYGGGFHSFYGRGFQHAGHHDVHHFADHDSGHWAGHGSGGYFGHRQPGHWHLSSGFGDHGHSHLEGVWSR